MTPQEAKQRYAVLNKARALLGTPYIWGGKDELPGFDCSGLAMYSLACAGVVPPSWRRYWNAQKIADEWPRVTAQMPQPGDVVCYGKDWRSVSHVMLVVGDGTVIGASGGDHTTTSASLAAQKRPPACVKTQPTARYRADFLGYVTPPYPKETV